MTTLEERDGVSMSDVVIRSTENGPNLVIVEGRLFRLGAGVEVRL